MTLDALAWIERVVDGDTWVGYRRPEPRTTIGPGKYRLRGVDTHETDADDVRTRARGEREQRFTEEWIKAGRMAWTKDAWPFKVEYASVDGEGEGSFGRELVDLVRRSDGQSLADALRNEFDDVGG